MEQSSMSPTLNRKEFIKVPPHLKQIDLFVLMRFIISKTAEKKIVCQGMSWLLHRVNCDENKFQTKHHLPSNHCNKEI